MIVKVVEKSFSTDYLKPSLQRIWKCSSQIQLIALGKGFYNVSIASVSERNVILSEGPWFINQFMILVQQWVAGFRPSEAVISTIPVWISLPELPIELHSLAMLKKIGDSIGTFLKTDVRAIEQNRLKFAKILVLIDLLAPLKENIWVGSFKQRLEFHELPLFCSNCSSIGHNSHMCLKSEKKEQVVEEGKEKEAAHRKIGAEDMEVDGFKSSEKPLVVEE